MSYTTDIYIYIYIYIYYIYSTSVLGGKFSQPDYSHYVFLFVSPTPQLSSKSFL